jgi:hypothetical protein
MNEREHAADRARQSFLSLLAEVPYRSANRAFPEENLPGDQIGPRFGLPSVDHSSFGL